MDSSNTQLRYTVWKLLEVAQAIFLAISLQTFNLEIKSVVEEQHNLGSWPLYRIHYTSYTSFNPHAHYSIPSHIDKDLHKGILYYNSCERAVWIMYGMMKALLKDHINVSATAILRCEIRPFKDHIWRDGKYDERPLHAVMRIQLNDGSHWIIDFTIAQYGYKGFLFPLKTYDKIVLRWATEHTLSEGTSRMAEYRREVESLSEKRKIFEKKMREVVEGLLAGWLGRVDGQGVEEKVLGVPGLVGEVEGRIEELRAEWSEE